MALFEIANKNSLGEARFFWWYTSLLTTVGRANEAISILDSAFRHFARTNLATRVDLAILLIITGDYTSAEALLRSTKDLFPAFNPYLSMAFLLLYEAQDNFSDAAANIFVELGQAFDPSTGSKGADFSSLLLGLMTLTFAKAGAKVASKYLSLLARKYEQGQVSATEYALGCIWCVNRDQAIELLEKAADSGEDPHCMWFHILPPFRHLRGNERYQALLKRLNLKPDLYLSPPLVPST